MDDGELDFTNQEMFTGPNLDELPNGCSMDSFFDDIFKDTHACSHTHTCNPPGPGPDFSKHTHTCLHVHTKFLPTSSEDKVGSDDTGESMEKESKKRPVGNREAVRKYREKKKARAASLEDEVVRLRTLNQQLMKRVQGQAALEAEIARLKCLLVDIRGRIDGEIGSFPYKKVTHPLHFAGGYVMNPCNMQCDDDQIYCQAKIAEDPNSQDFSACEFENLQCAANTNSGLKRSACEIENDMSTASFSAANKRRGTRVAKAG